MVQDNISLSARGVLRGLHYQQPHPQANLVHVLDGEIFDVAVDLRPDSPTFRRWVSATLSAENHRQLYIPEGFAHGFCVVSDTALVAYKCSDTYRADCDAGIAWDDPSIGIVWPVTRPILSPKDQILPRLDSISLVNLPWMNKGLAAKSPTSMLSEPHFRRQATLPASVRASTDK